jgi:LAO/AO transport system kinase
MSEGAESVSAFREAIGRGDRRAIARTITLLESTRPDQAALGQAVLDAVVERTGGAVRVGITGPPGVGKSSFIETLGLHLLGLRCGLLRECGAHHNAGHCRHNALFHKSPRASILPGHSHCTRHALGRRR